MIEKITAEQLFQMFHRAERVLSSKRTILDNLNVYPVPDGDTGANMSLTMREVIKDISEITRYDLASLAKAISTASLMGARGNSGVILSQFIGGFCEVIANEKEINADTLKKAFETGTKSAFDSVSDPVEGTILTIMKSSADAMIKTDSNDIFSLIRNALVVSRDTLQKTPDMLSTLKDAGVVDAGGAGFVYFLEGFHRALKENGNGEVSLTDDYTAPALSRTWTENVGALGTGGVKSIIDFNVNVIKFTIRNMIWIGKQAWIVIRTGKDLLSIKQSLRLIKKLRNQLKLQNLKQSNVAIQKLFTTWHKTPDERYCTEGILTGVKESPAELREMLSKMGTSLIVAKQGEYTKIHFHVKDKIQAKKLFRELGKIEKFKADDLHEQHKEFMHKKSAEIEESGETRVIAVVNGDGFRNVYESFDGVKTIAGGETMNPSISDFEEAISRCESEHIILLPNNTNIFMAAHKVADRYNGNVKVIETTDQAQGLSTLLNFNHNTQLVQNVEVMEEALGAVTTFSVAKATKSVKTPDGKVKKGEYIATTNKKIVAHHNDRKDVILSGIKAIGENKELVTLYLGKDVTDQEYQDQRDYLRKMIPQEIQEYRGGQPHYDYIVALE